VKYLSSTIPPGFEAARAEKRLIRPIPNIYSNNPGSAYNHVKLPFVHSSLCPYTGAILTSVPAMLPPQLPMPNNYLNLFVNDLSEGKNAATSVTLSSPWQESSGITMRVSSDPVIVMRMDPSRTETQNSRAFLMTYVLPEFLNPAIPGLK